MRDVLIVIKGKLSTVFRFSFNLYLYKEGHLPGGAPLWFDKLHRLMWQVISPPPASFTLTRFFAYRAPLYFAGSLRCLLPDCPPGVSCTITAFSPVGPIKGQL